MRKIRLLAVIVTIALIITLSLSACGNKDTELTKITLMEVTHSVFYAPHYVGITEGFFEEEGLEVSIIDGQGADKVMAALLSDQVEIGFMGPEASVYVYAQGKSDYAINFAQLTQRDGSFIVSREPSPDFTFDELRGKEILGGRKGGMPNMTLEYVLRKNGLDPRKDLNVRTDVQFGVMAGAFAAGEADYTTLFEPTASMIEKEGVGYVVASVGAESGYIPFTAYSAKESYIDENSDIIQKFTNAIYRSMLWVDSHSNEEVAKSLHPHFPDTDLEILTIVADRYRSIDAWAPNPVLSKEGLDRLQDVMIEAGELEERVPYEELVITNFAETAMENIQ